MRVGVITARMASGERGGAEALYRGLAEALRDAGHDAMEVPVQVDEATFESVLESYARCYALDLRDYDLVVSTKAPTFMVSHPNHVSYLLHTMRVFYDMFETEYGRGTCDQHAQRRTIHALDRFGLRPGRVRRHFSNGHTTYRRLFDASSWWKSIGFRALHHPPALSGFRRPGAQDYILVPGRLHRWKRVRLVIDAYKHVKRDVPLLITGTGEDEAALRASAKGDPRIRFLGDIGEAALIDLYADALLVPFVPKHEDYGLITIEAFKSGKAVLTCTDSGEPLQFVRDGHNGFVSPPNAEAIAERLTYAIDHRRRVVQMGRYGAKTVAHIAWQPIVEALVGRDRARQAIPRARRSRRSSTKEATFSVAVLDMQPIEPAVGGGRLRLLGLYHNLGRSLPTTYVGTYDWPGEAYRRHRLSETLEEIDVPLSSAHFAAAAEWKERAGGRTIIDTAFSHLAHHSADYVEAARRAVPDADIVVFSHPWVFPLVKDLLGQRPQLVVYDSHNVEAILRHTLLADSPFGAEIARHAAVIERDLCRRADLLLACSHEDRRLFHELYDVPFGKCVVVPNGTFTDRVAPATAERRVEAKHELGLPSGPVAIFIGSLYPPNVDAARFINTTLAPQLAEVTFVLCGGVGEALAQGEIAPNLRVTTTIPEAQKRRFLEAADIAVNPMFSGSGTNIKMFDFMAAGLPVVTTVVGARGCDGLDSAFAIASGQTFVSTIRDVLADRRRASSMGAAGRRLVSERYSWERISPSLGRLLGTHRAHLGKPRPSVSVIVPTYARHDVLEALMECLAAQTATNFEVIVVDQSEATWKYDIRLPFDLVYVHTDVKGASNARNTGAFYARGDILAFTDDDCRPDADWLESGLRYFQNPGVIGIEGLVVSDRAHDDRYRAVTNVGFEGIGFMTANLFLRRDTFHAVGGFDAQFDPLPFREDTDLGWRALEYGSIPFATDVRVYHPPQPRAIEREALGSRARFFENDALLLKKHPERYRTLFLRERHFAHTPGFFDHLQRGAARYGVQIDDFYLSHRQRARNEGTS
jgi:glycosyltransferase involved in cell wall biosynthesis/GT2 family glycosyltransferase